MQGTENAPGGCIVVADDHPVFREGLRDIVTRLYPAAVVLEAGTFSELLEITKDQQPDTLILDLLFPGLDPESSISSLRQRFSKTSIMVVSMLGGNEVIEKVLAQGADGFVNKAVSPGDLSNAISKIRQGEFVVLKAPTISAADTFGKLGETPLTQRQSEVLELIGEGMSNKDIARSLDISPFTVRIHVSAILRNLGVTSRAGAAARARTLKPHF